MIKGDSTSIPAKIERVIASYLTRDIPKPTLALPDLVNRAFTHPVKLSFATISNCEEGVHAGPPFRLGRPSLAGRRRRPGGPNRRAGQSVDALNSSGQRRLASAIRRSLAGLSVSISSLIKRALLLSARFMRSRLASSPPRNSHGFDPNQRDP
jgi:hypothetical protein